MAALLALLSAAVYGAGDFAGGLASRRLPPAGVVLRTNAIGLVGLAAVAPLIPAASVTSRDLLIGAGAGVAGGIGILLLYRGLALGTMSVVAPITAVLAAVVPVLVGLAQGERPPALALAGIPVALVAIALLARDPDAEGPAEGMSSGVLTTALGAGLGFGVFFVALDAAGDDAGLWPAVTGRVASVLMFAVVVATVASARAGAGGVRRPGLVRLLVVCGVCDAAANALFLLATHRGMLTTVAVLGSLYPASTVALATTLGHERLARLQIAGVVLALTAVVTITAG
jgi:drug/metabolite transporter (DMT)-like permease